MHANEARVMRTLDAALRVAYTMRMQAAPPPSSPASSPRRRAKGERLHFATLPDGTRIQRESENRTYSHVVAWAVTEAEVQAAERAAGALEAKLGPRAIAEWHALKAEYDAWGQRYDAAKAAAEAAGRPSYDDPECGRLLGRGSPWSAAGERLNAHPAAKLASLRNVASDKRRVAGKWHVAGWTSRLDLAQKLASQQLTQGKYGIGHPLRDVRILEVEREG